MIGGVKYRETVRPKIRTSISSRLAGGPTAVYNAIEDVPEQTIPRTNRFRLHLGGDEYAKINLPNSSSIRELKADLKGKKTTMMRTARGQ